MSQLITDLSNSIRNCEGYTGNPDLLNRVHWKATGNKVYTVVRQNDLRPKPKAVALVFPAVVDSKRLFISGMGSWSPGFTSGPDKAKWTVRFESPSEGALAMMYNSNTAVIKKLQDTAASSYGTGPINYASDSVSFRASAPMFEKRTTPLSKFESDEDIKMPLTQIEANWEVEADCREAWNKVMTKNRLLPMMVWKDDMKTLASPDEYADILPGALVEVHISFSFHAWGSESTFSARIEQLVLWRHGKPVQDADAAYADIPLSRGPYRMTGKRSIEQTDQKASAAKKTSAPVQKAKTRAVKNTKDVVQKTVRPTKKIPTKKTRNEDSQDEVEHDVDSKDRMDEEEEPALDNEDDAQNGIYEADNAGNGGDGTDSWPSRESSLEFTGEEEGADVETMDEEDVAEDHEAPNAGEEDGEGGGEVEPGEGDAAEEDVEEPEEERFHAPMSPAKRQKRAGTPVQKKKAVDVVPTTPIRKMRLTSSSPKETSPHKRTSTRSSSASTKASSKTSASKRTLPARSAKKGSTKA